MNSDKRERSAPPSIPSPWWRNPRPRIAPRSEEHTSELQSRFGISYAVFCLKKKNQYKEHTPLFIRATTAPTRPACHHLRRTITRAWRSIFKFHSIRARFQFDPFFLNNGGPPQTPSLSLPQAHPH